MGSRSDGGHQPPMGGVPRSTLRTPSIPPAYTSRTATTRLRPLAGDDRIGPRGTDGFDVLTLRGGLTLDRFRFTAAAENLTGEAYKYHSSGIYRPGRQLVLGAELSF